MKGNCNNRTIVRRTIVRANGEGEWREGNLGRGIGRGEFGKGNGERANT
jgi:hypothetical protein